MSDHQYGAPEQTAGSGAAEKKGQVGAPPGPGGAVDAGQTAMGAGQGAWSGAPPTGYQQATQGPMGGAAQPGAGMHGGYAAGPVDYRYANPQASEPYPYAPGMAPPQYPYYPTPQYAPHPNMAYSAPPPGYPPQYAPPGAHAGAGQPGAGVHAGMSQFVNELANGGNGLSSLGKMLNLDDSEFWKGALIGAAAVLLLTNESVQNALFKTGAKAKEAVTSSVEKVKKTARDATDGLEGTGD